MVSGPRWTRFDLGSGLEVCATDVLHTEPEGAC